MCSAYCLLSFPLSALPFSPLSSQIFLSSPVLLSPVVLKCFCLRFQSLHFSSRLLFPHSPIAPHLSCTPVLSGHLAHPIFLSIFLRSPCIIILGTSSFVSLIDAATIDVPCSSHRLFLSPHHFLSFYPKSYSVAAFFPFFPESPSPLFP